ncbi:hypothetical protein ACGFX8_33735, partial [Streptomyces sp. NPDC048362]
GFFFPMLSMMNIILPGPKPLISDVRQSEASSKDFRMTVAPERPVSLLQGRDLVSPELFERLVDFCAEEYGHERSMTERIMNEALAFIDVMGKTGEGMSPSQVVDPG